MNKRFRMIMLGIMSFVGSSAVIADADSIRFTGQESERLPVLTVYGPWTLDRSTRSDFPLLANSSERLHSLKAQAAVLSYLKTQVHTNLRSPYRLWRR
jgi:hypothetical protein